ncbi:hypothetical protein DSCO28_38370 [Desulfosarcina ovata subsp. sediminis]|uniref:Alginate export domain-containing protein n=1 Tax=Desulfosarcina ovata subsp. sediminis TaxID=885957 RepID=A0A5K7ZST0_9BACT|nr:hypothetical protein [Desulfosarcina ovata]BBO83271.1 hypothetical protein DSCO28_38370 [Desulfosarcina ovata subsp. sediminis]
MKKGLLWLILVSFILCPAISFADMGTMEPKSKDVEVNFFGSVKTYPTFLSDVDLNSDDTSFDWIMDESGKMADHNVRNEARIGWTVKGENFDFMVILEADFNLNKANGDRGLDGSSPSDSGMSGEDFGIEKLNVGYDFGPFGVKVGWNTRFLDIQTGGLLYGDDHPYIGFDGKFSDSVSWEVLYLIIQDETTTDGVGAIDADTLDWRVYTFKLNYKLPNSFILSPFYAYSDNEETKAANAKVHYLGFEGYGKLGMVTPRFELVYAVGDTDTYAATGQDYDISGLAGYASAEINISPAVIPYFGVSYESGDDNANDDDIAAFNGITNISRYTPTFGMENAFIYRYVSVLGSHLYSNNFAILGGDTPGYGGISNSSSGDSPGLLSYGIGVKGEIDKFAYRAQILFMTFEEEGALEDVYGNDIDSYVGTEYDIHLSYKFGKHFTLANCLSIFDPGDAVQDIRGDDYDDIGIIDTVEMTWSF